MDYGSECQKKLKLEILDQHLSINIVLKINLCEYMLFPWGNKYQATIHCTFKAEKMLPINVFTKLVILCKQNKKPGTLVSNESM